MSYQEIVALNRPLNAAFFSKDSAQLQPIKRKHYIIYLYQTHSLWVLYKFLKFLRQICNWDCGLGRPRARRYFSHKCSLVSGRVFALNLVCAARLPRLACHVPGKFNGHWLRSSSFLGLPQNSRKRTQPFETFDSYYLLTAKITLSETKQLLIFSILNLCRFFNEFSLLARATPLSFNLVGEFTNANSHLIWTTP